MEGIRKRINRNTRSVNHTTESIEDCCCNNAWLRRAMEPDESALKVDESTKRVATEKADTQTRDRRI